MFSIYIHHVPSIFTHSLSQLYADVIAFYIIGRHIPAIMQQLQEDLSALALHLDDRGLVLNPTMTQFLLLRRPNTPGIDEEAYLTCKGSTVIPASTVKYLGILIDEHLTFRPQVERVCSAVFGKLAAFKHGRRNLSLFAKRTFYLSIIQSTLDYASNSYVHSLGSRLFNRLVTVSHIAMKKLFGLDRMTPTVVVLRHYNLSSFEQWINLKLYVFCLPLLILPFLSSSHITFCFTCRWPAHTCSYSWSSSQFFSFAKCSLSLWFSLYFFSGSRSVECASIRLSSRSIALSLCP